MARVAVAHELQRAWLPLEIYPISAGVKGGLAGSVAMAVVAMLYGLVSQHSIWYPINLLAAGFLPGAMTDTTAKIAAFQSERLSDRHSDSPDHVAAGRVALRRHAADASAAADSAGRLHRAAILWSGLIHSILGIVNPVLNQRIHWLWFVASQVAIWDCRGHRCFTAGTHTHLAAPAARPPLGHGGRIGENRKDESR